MQEWQSKTCTCCGEEKPLKEFHKRRQTKSGYRSECKPCACKRRARYHQDNHEKSLATSSKWKQDNKGRVKEYSEQYALDNKDIIQVKRKAYSTLTVDKRKAYRLKNKDKYTMHKATRRFLERVSSVYNDEFNQFLMEECYSLSRLRTECTGIKWHVDHIVPLNGKLICGLHVGINLQVIPAYLNLRKGNKLRT